MTRDPQPPGPRDPDGDDPKADPRSSLMARDREPDPKLPVRDPDPERDSPRVSPVPTPEPDEPSPDVFDPGSEPLPA
jgi:hypothetical protein